MASLAYVTNNSQLIRFTLILSAKAGFFWAGMTALCFIWAFFRLPETKGLTFAELDVLFEKRVAARNFKKARVQSHAAFGATSEAAPQEIVSKDEKEHN